MNALLIEDELPAVRRLTHLLAGVEPDWRVVHSTGTVRESVEWLRQHRDVALIFSDIHLSDGLCFAIYQQVEPPCPIIFTTAYDEYAIQAFKLNSIDYLLKPIVADELRAALAKYHKLRATAGAGRETDRTPAFDVEYLIQSLTHRQPLYRRRFLVNYHDTYLAIAADAVAYFTSENKVTRLVQPGGRWFPIPDTLDELVDQLDPGQFFRVNRQFIIRAASLGTIHKHFNGKLKLDLLPAPADAVMVSRERADAFRNWLNQ